MEQQRSSSSEGAAGPNQAAGRASPLAMLRSLFAAARQRPLHALFASLCAALALTGIAVGAGVIVHLRGPAASAPAGTSALAELDAGRIALAQELAQEILASRRASDAERQAALFVVAAVAAREAEDQIEERVRARHFQNAAEMFHQARELGFPAGREAEGLWLLASSEFRSARYEESLPLLREALADNPPRKAELAKMLATACLLAPNRRLDEALAYNRAFLAERRLSPSERQAAGLQQAAIHYLAGRFAECEEQLEAIPKESPSAAGARVLRARLHLRAGDDLLAAAGANPEDAQARYGEAEQLVRGVLAATDAPAAVKREAQLLLGVCLERQGAEKQAEAEFSRARRLLRGTPEGIAAHLAEAELLFRAGRQEPALALYLELLPEISDLGGRGSLWESPRQWQVRLEGTVTAFREKGEYAAAATLAESLVAVLDPARAAELWAETEDAWARLLARRAEQAPAAEAPQLAAEARARFREAGVRFARLAELRYAERAYPDDLWRGAESFLRGQDYRQALRLFKKYLAQEPRERRAEALAAIGECYLALNKLELALPPLEECLENHRKEPSSYRARMLAARVQIERNLLAEAKKLLIDNLENESLAPSSLEWRDSLFALGKLMHREACELEVQSRKKGVDSPYPDVVKVGLKDLEASFALFQQAILRLEEAVERYPEAPQTLEARYLLADAHRQSAKWPRKLRGSIAIETSRATLQRQARDELTAALAAYEPLLLQLSERHEKAGLGAAELLLLRNSYFAKADVLFDLERFEEAIAAYTSAANRFHDQPEALEAFVQIASCYRRMNRPAEARGTLEQAKHVLRRIPVDAPFTRATRYDRGEWTQLLDWLSSL